MSIEVHIAIKATFTDEDKSKSATSELKKSLKKNDHELASALDSLNPIENQSDYKDETINVEEVSRKKALLSIYAYTYTSEEPIWFAKSLHELGATKIFIRGLWDGHGRNFYFLDGKKVAKQVYDGDKPKKKLSAKDIEINKNLFLPEGRVHVKATLVNHWQVGDIYESVLIEFVTDEGNTFFHKATGQLKQMSYEGSSNKCEFTAAFERGKNEGEFVSFAKRPTKVVVGEAEENVESTWRQKYETEFNTKAKCPFCGSSLRTEKAKQCPSCFKSWRETS
jgi:hypothetical protein